MTQKNAVSERPKTSSAESPERCVLLVRSRNDAFAPGINMPSALNFGFTIKGVRR